MLMSSNFSIVLVWAKGARQRRAILHEIYLAQKKGNPMFVSKLAKIYEEDLISGNVEKISRSAIRKHVEVLKKYGFVTPVNEGGKPEFLQLTEFGLNAIKKIENDS